MKVADVKLTWTKSPSSDITKVEVETTIDGNTTKVEQAPTVESFMIEVAATKTFSFKILSYDGEGKLATSETYTYTLGDLVDPLPATNLFHEVVAVRDVPDPVTARKSKREE